MWRRRMSGCRLSASPRRYSRGQAGVASRSPLRVIVAIRRSTFGSSTVRPNPCSTADSTSRVMSGCNSNSTPSGVSSTAANRARDRGARAQLATDDVRHRVRGDPDGFAEHAVGQAAAGDLGGKVGVGRHSHRDSSRPVPATYGTFDAGLPPLEEGSPGAVAPGSSDTPRTSEANVRLPENDNVVNTSMWF